MEKAGQYDPLQPRHNQRDDERRSPINDAALPGSDANHAGPERMLLEVARLQRELDVLSAELSQSHRLATLGTLAAAAAHEVNNILTPVVSYGQLAQQSPNDPELTAKALQLAVDNGQRASRLFTATLRYAKPGDGTQAADDEAASQSAATDPAEALQEAIDCMPREPQRDGITLDIDLPPAKLAIDSLELQQILLNLLLNARKALLDSVTRGPGIRVIGTVTDDAVSRYEIQVMDNGPGIPGKLLPHVFDPFVTQNTDAIAASDSKSGTGLGLAVCRRLIEKAKGTIICENQDSGGAVFTISLPLA